MTSSRLVFIGFIALGAGASTPGARERLHVEASPRVSYAPSNLTIRAIIDPDDTHRAIQVVADSGEYVRSSEVQLDGARAPRVTIFEFDNVPKGVYDVTAALKDGRGDIVARVDAEIRVIEGARGN
jgi:hypothetical protein